MGENPATGFVVNDLDDTNGEVYSFTITKTKNNINIKI